MAEFNFHVSTCEVRMIRYFVSVVIFTSIVATVANCKVAMAAELPVPNPEFVPYAAPDVLAKLPDGRIIHLKCTGAGSPTVILTAGLGNWSEVWRKVQPRVATATRVCAWDRAGFGFSVGSRQEQSVANTTSDLEAALKAAAVQGPYVMVGHSLGGYESLLFTDKHRDAVVGMVLVDPSFPDQSARLGKSAPNFMASLTELLRTSASGMRKCAAAAKNGELTLASPDPDGCLKSPSSYPAATAAELARLNTEEARWTAKISLRDNFDLSSQLAVNNTRNYGSMPLIILTAGKMQAIAGLEQTVAEGLTKGYPAFLTEWSRAHDELAALSSRGRNQLISESSHYIQLERPDVVIDAINDVVTQSRR